MDLFKEVLVCALKKKGIEFLYFPKDINIEKLFEKECFQALLKIRNILEDDSLEDEECFYKIDEIVNVFENLGYCNLSRHDFG